MRPYASVDIETTGLNKQLCDMLELGAVIDLGVGHAVQNLPSIELKTDNPEGYFHSEAYALNMNTRLIAAQIDKDVKKYSPKETFDIFFHLIKDAANFAYEWDMKHDEVIWKVKKVQIAGKNYGVFDAVVMNNYFTRKGITELAIKELNSYIMHRTMDVGPMYAQYFGYVPDLNQINKMIGYAPVAHTGLADAFNVVVAVRKKFGVDEYGNQQHR